MPITEMIYQVTESRAAAVVLTVLLGVCFINGTMGCITSASRLTYAMARDKGIVFPSTYVAFLTSSAHTYIHTRIYPEMEQ
jgi:choline transport protein